MVHYLLCEILWIHIWNKLKIMEKVSLIKTKLLHIKESKNVTSYKRCKIGSLKKSMGRYLKKKGVLTLLWWCHLKVINRWRKLMTYLKFKEIIRVVSSHIRNSSLYKVDSKTESSLLIWHSKEVIWVTNENTFKVLLKVHQIID